MIKISKLKGNRVSIELFRNSDSKLRSKSNSQVISAAAKLGWKLKTTKKSRWLEYAGNDD